MPWVPPHITPPPSIQPNLKTLRAAVRCVIETWPQTIYEQDFYAPPAKGVLYVQNADAVAEILSQTEDAFDQGPILRRALGPIWRSGIAVAAGNAWRWQRRAAAPVFAPRQAAEIIPIASAETVKLIQAHKDTPQIELVSNLSALVSEIVFESFLGQDASPAARTAFGEEGTRLTQMMSKLNLADLFGWPDWLRPLVGPTVRGPSRKLHKIVGGILVNATHETPLLKELRAATDPETGQKMGPEQIRDNIVGSLAAGRETTALAVAWAIYLVAGDPDIQAQLAAERSVFGRVLQTPEELAAMPLHRATILEAMRLYPPAPQIARQCKQTMTLAGQEIKAGTTVVIPVYALHRHPDFWDAPNTFDPGRFAPDQFNIRNARGRFLPFGAGPRICLGMQFAMMEAQTILATFLDAFEVRLADTTALDLRVGATLYPGNGLTVALKTRS